MAVSFLNSATDDLYATGEVYKSGDTLGVADVVVETTAHSENEDPIATGQVTCRFFD